MSEPTAPAAPILTVSDEPELLRVAKSVREALSGESAEDLQALREELRSAGAAVPARLAALPDFEEWAERNPNLYKLLLVVLGVMLTVAASRALPQSAEDRDGPAAPAATVSAEPLPQEPAPDEDLARIVRDVVSREQASPPSPATTPRRRERREQERRARRRE